LNAKKGSFRRKKYTLNVEVNGDSGQSGQE
jgi:hypothetical protein